MARRVAGPAERRRVRNLGDGAERTSRSRVRPPASLRTRLVAGLLAVMAVGLLVAGVVTWEAVRSFELARVDSELQLAQGPMAHELNVASQSPESAVQQSVTLLPEGTYGAVVDGGGHALLWVFPFQSNSVGKSRKPPAVPTSLLGTVAGRGPGSVVFSTVRFPGLPPYRLLARSLGAGAPTFVVAMPLTTVLGTLRRLALAEVIVGAAALAVVGMGTRWAVDIGLRPLDAIVKTAGSIAAGDLSRRVDRDEPTTEVGRLGAALNAMLAQIETSFEARAASERRLRQFVADAGHELRTPLTSIRGYAELFRRGAASRPDDLALAMRRIEAEAHRMGTMVEDLLLLARLDQRRGLELEPVELASLATDAVADMRAVEPDRPVESSLEDGVVAEADHARLSQVFANLLSNARSHTPPGTPVSVSVRAEDSVAVIEVADQGPGLPADQAAHVFERFYRADSSRKRSGESGSGLGLSIVAAIAQAHGGSVSLDTAPGRGAKFTVRIPLQRHSKVPGRRRELSPGLERSATSGSGFAHPELPVER